MDLADSFNNPEVSDLVLTFVTGNGYVQTSDIGKKRGRRSNEADDPPRRSLHVHKVVVMQSEFLKTKLQRWMQEQPPTGEEQRGEGNAASTATAAATTAAAAAAGIRTRGRSRAAAAAATALTAPAAAAGAASSNSSSRRHEIEVHVEADELDAAEMVTRFMYVGSVGGEPTAGNAPGDSGGAGGGDLMLLLRAYRLADMWGLPACSRACAAALAALSPEVLDDDALQAVFALPDGLREQAALAPLLAECQRRLLQDFGDVPAVIQDYELREAFCALPHAAVLLWLQSDKLQVHSENCVVLLLCRWVTDNEDCGAAHLQQLAHGVRVSRLSPAYLHAVLPSLAWFTACAGWKHLPLLLVQRQADMPFTAGSFGWQGPEAWVAAARRGSKVPEVELRLNIDQAALPSLFKGIVCFSDAVYVNGFFLELAAQCTTNERKPRAERARLYVRVQSDTTASEILMPSEEAELALDDAPRAMHGDLMLKKGRVWESRWSAPRTFAGSLIKTVCCGPTAAEAAAPYLTPDGGLQVMARLKDVR